MISSSSGVSTSAGPFSAIAAELIGAIDVFAAGLSLLGLSFPLLSFFAFCCQHQIKNSVNAYSTIIISRLQRLHITTLTQMITCTVMKSVNDYDISNVLSGTLVGKLEFELIFNNTVGNKQSITDRLINLLTFQNTQAPVYLCDFE